MDNNIGDQSLNEQQMGPAADELARDLYDLKRTYNNERDINAINERMKDGNNGYGKRNTDEHYGNRNTDEDYGKTSKKDKKGSSLEEKDGLEDKKEGEYDNDKKGDSNHDGAMDESSGGSDESSEKESDTKVDESAGDTDTGGGGGSAKKKLFKLLWKYKKYILLIGVPVAIFSTVFLFVAISAAMDSFFSGVSTFFGISETNYDSGEDDSVRVTSPGLYDNDEFVLDEDGEEISHEELVEKLEARKSQQCKATIGSKIRELFSGDGFSDACSFLRYIDKKTKNRDVDVGLVISTIFFGYEYQPSYSQYETHSGIEEITSSAEHFESLEKVISNKNSKDFINKSNVDAIIDNSEATYHEFFYLWVIEEEKDSNGKVTKLVGKCEKTTRERKEFSLTKWEVFMRFGDKASSKFDDAVLKVKSYDASDDECKEDKTTDDQLKALLESALTDEDRANGVTTELDTASIAAAREDLGKDDPTYSNPFFQFADIETKTRDVFSSFQGIEFDYTNGFAYKHFPAFEKSINDPNIAITYDSVFTPKEVEKAIQEIESKKSDLNDVLFLDDHNPYDTTHGDPGATGVVTGAYCGDYLKAKLEETNVRILNCDGRYLTTVPMEEYIMGVAYGEVSNSGDDYVLSQMVAALSYALHRRRNWENGNLITMRSGNCDQVFCPMGEGCTPQTSHISCGTKDDGTTRWCTSYIPGGGGYHAAASKALQDKYKAYYQTASQYLVVSDGHPHNCHYVSSIQNIWKKKSDQGIPFTQIIQETYQDEGAKVVRCTDLETPETEQPEESETRIGATATAEYPKVSPDKGSYYGFAYRDESDGQSVTINPDWKQANLTTITPNCPDTDFGKMSFTVHAKAVKQYEKAFDGVCKLLKEGVKLSDGSTCKFTSSSLLDGTVFVEKKNISGSFDLHAYGLAQDWNYSAAYTINGKTYKPYNDRNIETYNSFVEAIGGKEENCKNVNYILWLKAYKDAGFKWGGNYGRNGNSGTFDGKLFELIYEGAN